MKCKVCTREAQVHLQSEYCEFHRNAYGNILNKFESWKKAANVEWNEYLREVAENPFTGVWAKEVAENLLLEKEWERNV